MGERLFLDGERPEPQEEVAGLDDRRRRHQSPTPGPHQCRLGQRHEAEDEADHAEYGDEGSPLAVVAGGGRDESHSDDRSGHAAE